MYAYLPPRITGVEFPAPCSQQLSSCTSPSLPC